MSVIPGDSDRYKASVARWENIRYALDKTSRTIRLCVILLVMSIAAAVPLLILALAHQGIS